MSSANRPAWSYGDSRDITSTFGVPEDVQILQFDGGIVVRSGLTVEYLDATNSEGGVAMEALFAAALRVAWK